MEDEVLDVARKVREIADRETKPRDTRDTEFLCSTLHPDMMWP